MDRHRGYHYVSVSSIIPTVPGLGPSECVMYPSGLKSFRVFASTLCGFSCLLILAAAALGNPMPVPGGQAPGPGMSIVPGQAHLEDAEKQGDVDVYLKGPSGDPLQGSAVLTLMKMDGAFVDQQTSKNSRIRVQSAGVGSQV
jgi:hypothetical protein